MTNRKVLCALLAVATLLHNNPINYVNAEEPEENPTEITEVNGNDETTTEEKVTEQNGNTEENTDEELNQESTDTEETDTIDQTEENPTEIENIDNTEPTLRSGLLLQSVEVPKYKITLENCVLVDDEDNVIELEEAEAGQILKIKFVPNDETRDEFSKWNILKEAGEAVEVTDNSFEMPEDNITVTAEYDTYYQIKATNASASVEKAKAGDSVTVTFTESDKYLFDGGWTGIDSLSIKDKASTKLTFTMVESDLEIAPKIIDVAGKTGFVTANGKKYYYKNGKKLIGKQTIDKKQYYFDKNGVMQIGVVKIDGKQYLYNNSGVLQNSAGWHVYNNKWYYTDANGIVQTGWKNDGGKWYYMNAKGEMQTGWVKVGNYWYYLNYYGAMLTGWQKVGGYWYYLRPSGAMATGWLKDGKYWYYLKPSGAMAIGWQKVGNYWYYLRSSGAMATGWVKVGNYWYYLRDSGSMLTGWYKGGNTWYYLRNSGAMAVGWLKLPDAWYYFRDSGAMVSNSTVAIGGKIYEFAIGGQWIDYSYYNKQARPYYLKVNRALNTMTVYAKDYKGNPVIPIKAIRVSTAIVPENTPLGISQIGKKYRWYYFKEDECWLQYVSFFANGLRMMHSIAYWEDDPSTLVEGEYYKLGGVASHGCIRMTVINAKWIYDNCLGGTKVEVYDNWNNPGPLGKPGVPGLWDGTGWDPTDPDPRNPYN